MGLFGIISAGLQLAALIASAGDASPQGVIMEALQEVEDLLPSMCANEGQLSVIQNTVIPMFQENTSQMLQDPDFQWEDVDAGEYMDFVGEIVAEGNGIMENASEQAQEIQQELEEAGVNLEEE